MPSAMKFVTDQTALLYALHRVPFVTIIVCVRIVVRCAKMAAWAHSPLNAISVYITPSNKGMYVYLLAMLVPFHIFLFYYIQINLGFWGFE